MPPKLLTGNAAAAWGARLAAVDYVPAFPITPQTEIIEILGAWLDSGEMPGRMVTLESEHSMITAAGAAAATGVRVFSATSSQGLLYAMEMLYTVAGWRAPFVLVNVSRGLSAPITLEADHNDVLAARDSGFLQLHCADCQEVLDSVLLAYRLAEDPLIRLPVLVNLDGFYLSFTREPVSLPEAEAVRGFLPPFDPRDIRFAANAPASQAVAVLGGGPYSYFRYEAHLAALNGVAVYERVAAEFNTLFGRQRDAVECYKTIDAEIVFYMIGSFSTKAREAVDRLRDAGQKVGLVRPRLLRPFPAGHVLTAVAGKQGIIVIDQNLSIGLGGILYTELLASLYDKPGAPPVVTSFIGGLGGRDISPQEFYHMLTITRQAIASGSVPPPRLLYTAGELREIRKLQAIAQVEREETAPGQGPIRDSNTAQETPRE
ncbi:MAG: pyruvate synthase [Gammaproteobacteria bacterium]|jgi:pyruvate ferredoxin oxidoreductase alpha subunit|nr:pyruvate synthase [Gammaproteobacteria bacterium]MDH5171168.1 pyruvate synthase [Gammaproteobacteria bacterium]